MKKVINNLTLIEDEITAELEVISSSFDGNGLAAFLELAKCMDHSFVAASFLPAKGKQKLSFQKLFKRFSIGWYDVIKLFNLTSDMAVIPFEIKGSTATISWANKTLIYLGNIAYLKRVMKLSTQGFYECVYKDSNTFRFINKDSSGVVELFEAQQQHWLTQEKHNNADYLHRETIGSQFHQLLWDNVYSKDSQFISYDTNTTLDTFFYKEGIAYASSCLAYDNYDSGSSFGGIKYETYQQIVAYLIGLVLKHKAFCFKYQEKTGYGIVSPWDTYSRTVSFKDLFKDTQTFLSIHEDILKQVFSVIITTPQVVNDIPFPPGYAPPLLIKIGKDRLLVSMMGHLSNPFVYLNRCLKFGFKDDYAKAVNEREDLFRAELYELFDDKLTKVDKNLNLREGKILITDIDAVIYDAVNNIILLIQLKWNDDWGTDMDQRRSMQNNYEHSIIKWIQAIDGYLSKFGLKRILQNHSLTQIQSDAKVYKLVIGRHFSKFSRSKLPKNFLNISWPYLIKLLSSSPQCSSNLRHLIDEIISSDSNDSQAIDMIIPRIKDHKFVVGKFNIEIASVGS